MGHTQVCAIGSSNHIAIFEAKRTSQHRPENLECNSRRYLSPDRYLRRTASISTTWEIALEVCYRNQAGAEDSTSILIYPSSPRPRPGPSPKRQCHVWLSCRLWTSSSAHAVTCVLAAAAKTSASFAVVRSSKGWHGR